MKETQYPILQIFPARAELFRLYELWIYGSGPCRPQVEHSEEDPDTAYNDLVSCWMLGDGLQDETFQNAVMSFLTEKLRDSKGHPDAFSRLFHPDHSLVRDGLFSLYRHSLDAESPLRRLAVDAIARFANNEDIAMFIPTDNQPPSEFLIELILALTMAKNEKPIETKRPLQSILKQSSRECSTSSKRSQKHVFSPTNCSPKTSVHITCTERAGDRAGESRIASESDPATGIV